LKKKPKHLQFALTFRAGKRRLKKFRRPKAGAPQCQNYLRRRAKIRGHYVWLKSVQCAHHGWLYNVNGYKMVLCVCCARRLYAREGCKIKEIKGAKKTR
jgi:hypothetical protein